MTGGVLNQKMGTSEISSGIKALDEVLQGIRLGDNVVWQVDRLEDYLYFAVPFAEAAIAARRRLVYLRFASHPPVLSPRTELEVIELDPSLGFDYFTREVHLLIEAHGPEVMYVFDNLSALVVEWATDESLANFFQITCPFLFELNTVAYFALTRGQHAHYAVARIRDTTQILVDVYHAKDQMHIHPIKVWDRYSPRCFYPISSLAKTGIPFRKVAKPQKYWPQPINPPCSKQRNPWLPGKVSIKNFPTTTKTLPALTKRILNSWP